MELARSRSDRLRWQEWSAIVVITLAACLFCPGKAQAAPGCEAGVAPCPPFLYQLGEAGAGPGQLKAPGGIAADPGTGHVFVADTGLNRISEFDSRGEFVKAWGWGVRDGSTELQVCTAETGCIKGLGGTGAGQLEVPVGIAIDQKGSIWSVDLGLRLQKFTPEGEFVLMAGGEVNKTKVGMRKEQEANSEPVTVTEAEENLCTAASGDICGGATEGSGDGQFEWVGLLDAFTVGPDGLLYAGDWNRIQKFDDEGTYEGEIPLAGGKGTESLAISSSGRLYVISKGITHVVTRYNGQTADSPVVREVSPSGEELERLSAEWNEHEMPQFPGALAADAEGNVYVTGTVVYEKPAKEDEFEDVTEVVAFDAKGGLISFEPDEAGFNSSNDGTLLTSLATNVVGDGSGGAGEVFVGHLRPSPSAAYVRSFGIPFKPVKLTPEIDDHHVVSAATTEATVEALIKPGFTTDTTYQVEYGTETCSAGGCESLAPIPPVELGGGGVNSPVATGPVTLPGLVPGTTYHYRFRAENEATDEEESGPALGAEGTFKTFSAPKLTLDCPNAALRSGAGAQLPDCRAYEMVSPVDKGGGEVVPPPSVPGFPAGIDQGAPSGETLTYSSFRAFADPAASPFTSQYVAHRDAGGWSSEPISPPRAKGNPNPALDTEYTAFSRDLSKGWLTSDFDPPLTEDAIEGYRNLYRRDNETDVFEAQCPVTPPQQVAGEFRLETQGSSEDGSHLVFRANDKLTDDALAGVTQVYECIEGTELRLVGVLPGGEASSAGSSTGTAYGGMGGFGLRINNVAGAVSEDGSRIFWTAASNGAGPLYVRIDGTSTVQITASGARFRAASPDGTRVLYSVADDLFEASVSDEAGPSTQIAGDVAGFMGSSEDTKLVYFVSGEDLDGGGPATAGRPNLYLYRSEPDTYSFIGELSGEDAQEASVGSRYPVLTPASLSPYHRSSRVTSDGLHAAFTSSAPLTGFDNTDQASGQAGAEVFLYDAAAGELLCVSCNPTGARPRGADLTGSADPYWVAAKIPGWANQGYPKRALSQNGDRLFFEAVDPLVLGDTNGVQDVYQWESLGTGTCTEVSSGFSASSGGCIALISSGKSPEPSEFVDASPSGDDVFFRTAQSLWSPDPGWIDIYDARVGGGFMPLTPGSECEGGGCQSSSPPPQDPMPGTASFVGPNNVAEEAKAKPKKCRKGTHRVRKAGKVRCVKSKGKAGKGRRASR